MAKNKKNKKIKKYSGQQQKEIDCDEPHPVPNEKTQPIQWTERPTGVLVAINSLWPSKSITPHKAQAMFHFFLTCWISPKKIEKKGEVF
jgi:hypothetical protein